MTEHTGMHPLMCTLAVLEKLLPGAWELDSRILSSLLPLSSKSN